MVLMCVGWCTYILSSGVVSVSTTLASQGHCPRLGADKIIISLYHGVVCYGLHFGCLHLCRGRRWHTVDILGKTLQQMRRLGLCSASAPAAAARDSRRQQKTAEDSTRGAGQDTQHERQAHGRHHAPHATGITSVRCGMLKPMARFSLRPQFPAQTPGARDRQAACVRARTRAEAAQRGAAPTSAVLDSRSAACCGGRELRFTSGAHTAVSRGAHKRRGGTGAEGTRRVCALTVAVLQDLKHRNRAVPFHRKAKLGMLLVSHEPS
jgi:hypothetical protein